MQTRRNFLKTTVAAGAGLAAYGVWRPRPAYAFYQSGAIPLWRTTLRGVGPGGIPVAVPDVAGGNAYSLTIGQFDDQLLPDGFGKTTLWGYNPVNALGVPGGGSQTPAHLGGIIVAQKGQPIQLTFTNNLPSPHIIPVDTTIPGAEKAQNRAAVHLHGGLVPWTSDGGPFAWFAPDGTHGESFVNPGPNPNQATYDYPMNQSARFLWYHDHAIGITRINAYAGIASGLLVRDGFEAGLIGAAPGQGLPDYIEKGGFELPIVVQDKIFVDPNNISALDPTWPFLSRDVGSSNRNLWYAHVYDTARYGKLGPAPAGPPPDPSVVPEFFGDTMLANGTVFPEVTVEARRYRLRILNACNARFLNLQLYVDDGSPNGITLDNMGNPANRPARNAITTNPAGKPNSNWLVLGTEGGFLPNPVAVPSNVPFNGTPAGGSLLLAPAERADVLFDFSLHAGQKIILYTDTPAPFPMGDPRNDYFPGLTANKNPVNGLTQPGFGPNTREIMRFKVVAASSADPPLTITTATDLKPGNDPLLAPLGVTTPPTGVFVRQLTLNESFDQRGRLIQLLGTDRALPGAAGFGRPYESDPTEVVHEGDTEVWQITNLTADTHPIHFHLVNVQIISRQAFTGTYKGTPNLSGAPLPPAPFERGWKETVRMNPGEVTTVIMKFDLPVAGVTNSPRLLSTYGLSGHEYVWHCHILEHEEHDMMRPLVVVPRT